jgi:hypothetical protein
MKTIVIIGLLFYSLPLFIYGIFNIIQWKTIAHVVPPYIPKWLQLPLIILGGSVLAVSSTLIFLRKFVEYGSLGLFAQMVVFIIIVHIPNLYYNPAPIATPPNTKPSIWDIPYNPLLFLFKDLNIAGAALVFYSFASQIESL